VATWDKYLQQAGAFGADRQYRSLWPSHQVDSVDQVDRRRPTACYTTSICWDSPLAVRTSGDLGSSVVNQLLHIGGTCEVSPFRKKATIPVCDMCGEAEDQGCGDVEKHVERITGDEPAWLPADWRAQGVGQYTWICTRCNSYPDQKWPSEGGASSAMTIHLGKHGVGQFARMAVPVNFNMVPR
jgi:hypothetical protein